MRRRAAVRLATVAAAVVAAISPHSSVHARVADAGPDVLPAFDRVRAGNHRAGGNTYRFLQFNMAGSAGHGGGLGTDALGDVARSIRDFRPAAVSLNEICKVQFDHLLTLLEPGEHPMSGRFVTTKRRGNDCKRRNGAGEKQYGMAVLVADTHWRSQDVDEYVLLEAEERRKLACVRVELTKRTRVCTTHVAPSDDDVKERRQIRKVARIVDEWVAAREPVVLMGDFNAAPQSRALDPIYSAAYGGDGHGRFLEVDGFDENGPCRCGDRTTWNPFGDKIDYVFVSETEWRPLTGEVTDTTTNSDHRLLRGSGVLAARDRTASRG